MKNINVRQKLIICFCILLAMMLVLCGIGVYGMHSLNTKSASLYDEVFKGVEYIGLIRENFQAQRVAIQTLGITTDPALISDTIDDLTIDREEMREYLATFDEDIIGGMVGMAKTETLHEAYTAFAQLYYSYFEPEMTGLMGLGDDLSLETMEAFITSDESLQMKQYMNDGQLFCTTLMDESLAEAEAQYVANRRLMVFITMLAAVIAYPIVRSVSRGLALPLRQMVRVADAIAVGDMGLEIGHEDRGDEVGMLARALHKMRDAIGIQVATLAALARADLTVKPIKRSEADTMGQALIDVTRSFSEIVGGVTATSGEVGRAARGVASQSQELAQGTTEQAASVEQLSSAFFEISLNTKESASLAEQAATRAESMREMALSGAAKMVEMIDVTKAADEATQRIDSIIKVIDEIAFQTNLLALNAAVEAARAGATGAGFAVVAGEVRNLASKSSASAKETSELIGGALEKVRKGAEIAEETAKSFDQIVDGVVESSMLSGDIARAAKEQAQAIEQINTGITQVVQVIHANSGAAEASAAAAEQMSVQAQALEDIVARFRTDETAKSQARRPAVKAVNKVPKVIDLSPTIPTEGFGKY